MEEWTESTQSTNKFNIDDMYRDCKEFQRKLEIEHANTLRGIPVLTNPFAPKGTIMIVDNKETLVSAINIWNSKLYRFINWYQKLFRKFRK